MAEFKLVLNDPKTGKSLQKEVKDNDAKALIGLKIGDTVKGELFELPGYEFVITGGSDSSGFPMRKDVDGPGRKAILSYKGVGVKNKLRKPNPKKKGWRTMKGMRLKKTVAGNTIYDKTVQVNLKITKYGRQPLFEEEKVEEPKEEKTEKKEDVKDASSETKPDESLEELEKDVKKDEEDIKELDKEESEVEEELKKVDGE